MLEQVRDESGGSGVWRPREQAVQGIEVDNGFLHHSPHLGVPCGHLVNLLAQVFLDSLLIHSICLYYLGLHCPPRCSCFYSQLHEVCQLHHSQLVHRQQLLHQRLPLRSRTDHQQCWLSEEFVVSQLGIHNHMHRLQDLHPHLHQLHSVWKELKECCWDLCPRDYPREPHEGSALRRIQQENGWRLRRKLVWTWWDQSRIVGQYL
jgi:hypothetical protein